MKKLILLGLSLFLTCSLASAQSKTWNEDTKQNIAQQSKRYSAEERATKQTQEMVKALNLTADQEPKVKEALLAFHTSMESTRKGMDKKLQNMDAEERKALKATHLTTQDELKEKMKSILNEEQYASFTRIMGDMQKKKRRRAYKK